MRSDLLAAGGLVAVNGRVSPPLRFRDPALPLDERLFDLVGRLTLDEKVSQMMHTARAVPRLGIPAYNYWNEALHGVARNGRATVFPQIIGLAASWDAKLVRRVASAIADEARAKHHEALRRTGESGHYQGLTFWSPNINIFRDPRWGRGQETWGEDPVLTGVLGAAFVRGLQGDDPRHLKTAACAKHFAVHSGPEAERHTFDAAVTTHDLWDTYLPAFEKLVRKAGVESVMGAYNRVRGEPCCASKFLLEDVLRGRWKFTGHVVSDCWALTDIHKHHRVTADPVETAALALRRGCDLSCGCTFDHLGEAVRRGLVTEDEIDTALARHLRTRFKLGMFDPPETVRWARIKPAIVAGPKHGRLAYEAAVKSCVLLRNRDGILPLKPGLRSLYVTGPLAASVDALLGNYHGVPTRAVTFLEGLAAALPEGVRMDYRSGCLLSTPKKNDQEWAEFEAAACEVTIACLGFTELLEGEEGDAIASATLGDREDLLLPEPQRDFLRRLLDRGCKVVVVLASGGAVSLGDLEDRVEAVLWCGYPGQEGGRAVADLLLGRRSPAGKLPVTFHRDVTELPPFADYSMRGRTHRWFEGEPAYPFGFGLGYTTFEFSELQLEAARRGRLLRGRVTVGNTGTCEGREIVQVYVTGFEADDGPVPRENLAWFQPVDLPAGESQTITFAIPADRMTLVDQHGRRTRRPQSFEIFAGGSPPHPRCAELGAPRGCRQRVVFPPKTL
jgi:beta-glucosidase